MFCDDDQHFYMQQVDESSAELLYDLIIEMATYEKDLHEVQTSVERIKNTICNQSAACAYIGYMDNQPAAYVIYFYTYSSYIGKRSIYIEDIYIKPEHRKLGLGKKMMSFIAKLALKEDCGRLDWTCLDWNTSAIGFYKHLGARHLEDRLYFRAEKQTLKELAGLSEKI